MPRMPFLKRCLTNKTMTICLTLLISVMVSLTLRTQLSQLYNIIIMFDHFEPSGALQFLDHSWCLTISPLQLILFAVLVFEIGYYVGRTASKCRKETVQRPHKQLLALPPSISHPENPPMAPQPLSEENNCVALASAATWEQFVDGHNLQNILLKERVPLRCANSSTQANFKVYFQNMGKKLLKTESYEIVTEFDNQPCIEAEVQGLKSVISKLSARETPHDDGFQIVLNRRSSEGKTQLLFKSISSAETESTLNQVKVTGMLENGKFQNMFYAVKKIGEGGFGCVYHVINKIENKPYAIKKIYLTDLRKKDLLKEVTIVSHLSHKNIVRYYSWWIEEVNPEEARKLEKEYEFTNSSIAIKKKSKFQTPDEDEIPFISSSEESNGIVFMRKTLSKDRGTMVEKKKSAYKENIPVGEKKSFYALHIQMEICEGGSVAHYLQKRTRKADPATAFNIFTQILDGVQLLHQNGVVHRDLKPGNIFIDQKQRLLKIGDFGLSTAMQGDQLGEQALAHKLGTPTYMAPQLTKKQTVVKPQLIDIFSLGIIYYQLLNVFSTEHERSTKLKAIREGKIDLQGFERERRLIRSMTCSCRNRLTALQIRVSEPYLQLEAQFGTVKWASPI